MNPRTPAPPPHKNISPPHPFNKRPPQSLEVRCGGRAALRGRKPVLEEGLGPCARGKEREEEAEQTLRISKCFIIIIFIFFFFWGGGGLTVGFYRV